MKLVRRVPRMSPLHMDLQCFPWCSIMVTCGGGERRAISTGGQGSGDRGDHVVQITSK